VRRAPGFYKYGVGGLANGFLVVKHNDFEREGAAISGTSVAGGEGGAARGKVANERCHTTASANVCAKLTQRHDGPSHSRFRSKSTRATAAQNKCKKPAAECSV
jgi:hypothetical protein